MGDIIGTAIFIETAENQASITTGIFTDSSLNNGDVLQNTYFYNNATNGVSGDPAAVNFYDSATNLGSLTGVANFSNTSTNDGIIAGAAIFKDSASNTGLVSSSNLISFSNSAINLGILNTTQPVQFSNTSTNAGTAVNAEFSNSSVNTGLISVSATFTGSTANSGTVVTGVFRDTASNIGLIIDSSIFAGESTNTGIVSGNASFLDSSTNTGSVSGDAAFTGNASNEGIVYGDAEFQVDILTDEDPDPELDFIQLDDELDFLLVSDNDLSIGIVSGEAISLTSVRLLSAGALNNINISGVEVSVGTYDLYDVAGGSVALNYIYYPSGTEIYNDNISSYIASGQGQYYIIPTTRKKWITSIGDIFTAPTAAALANAIGYLDASLTILLVNTMFNYGGISYQTDSTGLITPNI